MGLFSPTPDYELRREVAVGFSILSRKMEKLMSAISDYAAKVTSYFTRLGTALDDIKTEIKTLNDQIAALQNSSGAITPEDQALLDAAAATASGLADKADALDTLPKPVAPPA